MAPAAVLNLGMEKATFLKNVLEVLSCLFHKANFEFSKTGLELQALDTSCVALVVLRLSSESFDHYICKSDGFSVGLNLAEMAQALSFFKNDDIVTIKAQYGVETVFIKFKSPDSNVNLNVVGVNDLPTYLPQYRKSDYQAIIRMPSAELSHFYNKLRSFTGDVKTVSVCISVDKDSVHFFTVGILDGQLKQTVDKSKEATDIELKRDISLKFELSYMISLCKLSTLSDQVTIKLSSKLPAAFEYNTTEMAYIRYYVIAVEIKAGTQAC